MIVIDANAVVTAFNPAAERMFGYSREQVVGQEMARMLIPERFREAHRDGVRRNGEAGVTGMARRLELIALRADGTEFGIELSMSRLETDGKPFFSGSIRDLTDRDRLGGGPGVSCRGVGDTLTVGRNAFDVLAGIPEAMEHVRRALAGTSFSGAIHVEGLDLWLETSYDPIRNEAGEVTGLVALATDVSDRVRGDAARQESDAKSRLGAIVNHEGRTPLTSILGFAELLQMDRVGPLNAKQARYIDNVESAGRHLLALVNDSLDLSKLAAGKMDLDITTLAGAPIVGEAAG